MAYLQLGVVDTSHFNSTKYPGVCKPSDAGTLLIFKNLQAQLNRVAQGLGFSKISVDGDIGAGTVNLLAQIAANISQGGVSADPARNILAQTAGYTCIDIASNADMLGDAAQGMADQMSVPPQITQPSSGTSTLVSSSGGEVKVHTPTPASSASIADALAGMDTTTLLLLAAGAGAVIYYTGGPKRGSSRKSKSTKSSHRASRRRSNYRYR